ncbi:NADPH-dependent oxidoreductase [Segetibacter sp. 3557_3]|uniref:NADPH-dependent FMN reductase n=1 Tax=Segetibacter sp. 3557_3 TaxID=2547429 RepID=UPI00105840FA|nr:NAD(P)H-dependent oxidoreductase [Segetibacter sp. 3557_3]TDH28839.1 NADPH-dependent oxidoreductase [Segetibacter sp. 3557_3]
MPHIHLVGISGSLRKDSFNTALLHAALTLLPEEVSLEIASIADLPVYNADQDLPTATERPAAVTAFRNILAKADGFVIVSPEYNYSIPGGLKNAIDWASRGEDTPMANKAVALMGATPGLGGTLRMQVAFHPVFQFLNMRSVYKPEVAITQVSKKFTEGQLTDEPTKELIKKQLVALKALVLKMKDGQ